MNFIPLSTRACVLSTVVKREVTQADHDRFKNSAHASSSFAFEKLKVGLQQGLLLKCTKVEKHV